jgi:hypothetical protein
MKEPSTTDIKNKYDMARHHAWAGSVLLAVLLALRVFFLSQNDQINETIFLLIGIILIMYILIGLLLTYRYRSALCIDPQTKKETIPQTTIDQKVSKERLKLEKKKAKIQVKQQKKQGNFSKKQEKN